MEEVGHLPLKREKRYVDKGTTINIHKQQSVRKGLTDEDAWTFKKIQQEKVERLEKAKQKTGKHRAGVIWGKENSDGSKIIEVWEKNTEGKEKGHNLPN